MSLFLSGDASIVYALILGRGSENPIPLADLCARTGLSARAIKGIVESLRTDHRLPVGASRKKPSGYYICKSADELEASAKPMVAQAKRMLQAAARLLGKKRVREMLGQGVLG